MTTSEIPSKECKVSVQTVTQNSSTHLPWTSVAKECQMIKILSPNNLSLQSLFEATIQLWSQVQKTLLDNQKISGRFFPY